MVNDGVINVKHVQIVATPSKPTTTNSFFNTQTNPYIQYQPHNNVSTQGRPPYSNNQPQHEYTLLAEPIQVIFQNLVKASIFVFLITSPFNPNKPKPRWYNENEYCDYHHVNGHDTCKRMKLNNYIKDLTNKGDIEVTIAKPGNSNDKLKMYQDPFPKHGKYKASSSHEVRYDYGNYVSVFESLVGRIVPIDTHVNTITIQGVDPPLAPDRPRFIIQGVSPSQSSSQSSQAKIVI